MNIETWINFIKQVNTDESLLILCGNKNDLERQINYKEGFELAQKNDMLFFETSAKTGNNIDLMMFTAIARLSFFSQFQIDKDSLIKELQKLNSKNDENNKEEKNDDLKIIDENNNNVQIIKTVVRKKKKKCC